MEICRLCLTKTKTNWVLSSQELVNQIKNCVSIEIHSDDNYSKQVCDLCLVKVNNWYEFKKMCLESKCFLENNQFNELLDIKHDIVIIEDLKTVETAVTNKDIRNPDFQSFEYTKKDTVHIRDFNILYEENRLQKLEITDEQTPSNNCTEQKQSNICSETNKDTERYSCDVCSEIFEYFTDYLDHQNDHKGEAVFHCTKCKMTFLSKLELVQHEKGHKVTCQICGTLVQKQSLKLHLNKHTDKFKCKECSLTFTCGPLLREHITARHMKLKLHFCNVCAKDFATKSSLVLHLKTHSEKREYECEKCDYAGKTSISLRIHMSKHENNTCICEYCSKIFKSYRNLNDHLNRVHRSKKKHICEYCGMKFALRYQVEQHKRTHTGVHPYNCSKCSKTFARSDGLKEHIKTHNRTERFICNECSKQFLTARGLKRHICLRSSKAN